MNPDGPAQTFSYMLLGYGVILACVGALVVSIAARYRALKHELQRLQELERQDQGRGGR